MSPKRLRGESGSLKRTRLVLADQTLVTQYCSEEPVKGEMNSNGVSKRKVPVMPPKKKMTIKPFKVKPQLPDSFEEKTFEKLENAIKHVLEDRAVQCSQEELYRSVETMCMHKKSEQLFCRLRDMIDIHVYATLLELSLLTVDHFQFLQMMYELWQDYCSQLKLLRSIFLYLDRTFVYHNREIRSIWNLGLEIFAKHFEGEETISVQRITIKGILALIERERRGESVDRSLLRALIRMFTMLKISHRIEEPIFEATKVFYNAEGNNLLLNILPVPEYLSHVSKRLREEEDRAQYYMNETTMAPLINFVEIELIRAHAGKIIEKGFETLMDTNRVEDIARMYSLLARVNSLEGLKKTFAMYVRKVGHELVLDKSKDPIMIQALLDFQARLDTILKIAFQSNLAFSRSVKDQFEFFINARANKPAELIAKYVDNLLRTGNRAASEDEIERIFDQVLILFRYINGKDVFEAFYKKDLAKRLLLNNSASAESERSIVSRLRKECGSPFTQNIEGMFNDMELSDKFFRDFKAHLANSNQTKIIADIEYYVHVLTTSNWPTVKSFPPLNLPSEILNLQKTYESFYVGAHKQARQLQWDHSMSHGILLGKFPKGHKELLVSAHQACILVQFNHSKTMTFAELQRATAIEIDLLKRTLDSLLTTPKVLQKKPKGQEIQESDQFRVNPDFESKLFRIKVNSVQIQETEEEKEETTQKVFADRQYQLDACIVRIMKARRTLSHSLLVSEVLGQAKFPVEVSEVKKQIASLLEREYMERDRDNSSTYHYVA